MMVKESASAQLSIQPEGLRSDCCSWGVCGQRIGASIWLWTRQPIALDSHLGGSYHYACGGAGASETRRQTWVVMVVLCI